MSDLQPRGLFTGGRSPGLKFVLIIALTIAMAVPLFFIQLALSDRESTANVAVQDVATGWGGRQTAAGPVLYVPYTVTHEPAFTGAAPVVDQRTAVLLPSNLAVAVHAAAGERWRGIFKVPVYKAAVDIHANFDEASLSALVPPDAKVQWNRAFVAIFVSDSHGLADNVALTVNGRKIAFQPGSGANMVAGIHAPLGLTGAPGDLTLDTKLVLRGSQEFSLAPLGKRTTATVDSDWASPSFFGSFLPSERNVTNAGFKASWTVPYLARGFEQSFATTDGVVANILSQSFGVRFYQPIDYYQLVERSLKYAILFVTLAFLIFFVTETISTRQLHAIQYALVGSAQVLFYLLLLSLAEHFGFALSYAIAAGATVTLTGLYAASAFASGVRAVMLTAILGALYGLLYVILNAEDYALLIGSGVLFAALAATMYATRRIDWYRLGAAPA